MLGLGFFVLLLIAIGIMWHKATVKIVSGLNNISAIHYPLTESCMQMQLAVVQVQQRFSNAALTGDPDELESAFTWSDYFHTNASKALKVTDDPEMKKQIRELVEDFSKYFNMAEIMVKVYFKDGAEAGNSILIDTDAFVMILQEKINVIVDKTRVRMASTLQETEEITVATDSTNGMISIMMVAISIALAYFLSSSITNPLKEVIIRFRGIASEEVADLSKRVTIETHDEIAEVGELFNEFVSKIELIVIDLFRMAQRLASATAQLSVSTERGVTQAKSQLGKVSEVSSAIEEVNKAISGIAAGAVEVSSTSTKTHKHAVEGGKVIRDSAKAIQKLSEYSSKIGAILLVIEDIAKKTDLLAINAAIEAANAGDQGKGFAVVADEVRKLAERTTSATSEISVMIKDIQTFTFAAVDSMKGSNEVMNEIISEATSVNKMVKEITASSEMQSTITTDMLDATRVLLSLSDGFSSHTEHTENVAGKIDEQVTKLRKLVGRFNIHPERARKLR